MVPSDRALLLAITVSVLPSLKDHLADSLSSLDVLVAAQVNVKLPPSGTVTLSLG